MFAIDRDYVKSALPARDPAGHKGTFGKACLLGGSVGALLGMLVFHHKTKHWYFVWGIPLILLAQIALAVWVYFK